MRQKRSILFHIIIILFVAVLASNAVAYEYENSKKVMKEKLEFLESEIIKIENSSEIQIDSMDIETAIKKHTDATKKAYDHLHCEMKKYAETNGQQGNVKIATDFDNFIKEQKNRAELVVAKMAEIDGKIRTADIMLTRKLVEKMNKEEMKEFRKSLTPKADKKYKKKMPDIVKGEVSHFSDKEWLSLREGSSCNDLMKLSTYEDERYFLDNLSDILVPRADAELNVGCYYMCVDSGGSACFGCVAGTIAAEAVFWQQLQKCEAGCCRCRLYKPWDFGCKAACWFGFLAIIA